MSVPIRVHKSMTANYYEVLGISRDSSQASVRAAYLRLAQEYHPDLNRNDSLARKEFKQIQKAYEVLRNPHTRAHYDRDPEAFDSPTDAEMAGNAARAKGNPSTTYGREHYGAHPYSSSTATPRQQSAHSRSESGWPNARQPQLHQQRRVRELSGARFAVASICLSAAALSLIAYEMVSQRASVVVPIPYVESPLASTESSPADSPEAVGPDRLHDPANTARDTAESASRINGSDSASDETVTRNTGVQAASIGALPATLDLETLPEPDAVDALAWSRYDDYNRNIDDRPSSQIDPTTIVSRSWQPSWSFDSPNVSSNMAVSSALSIDTLDLTAPITPAFPSTESLDEEWLRAEVVLAREVDTQGIGGTSRLRTGSVRLDGTKRANGPSIPPAASLDSVRNPSSYPMDSPSPRNMPWNAPATRTVPQRTSVPQAASVGARFSSPQPEPTTNPNVGVGSLPITGIMSDTDYRSPSFAPSRGVGWQTDSRPAFQHGPAVPSTGRPWAADFSFGPGPPEQYEQRPFPPHPYGTIDRATPLLQPHPRPGVFYGQFGGAPMSGSDRYSGRTVSPTPSAPYSTGFDSAPGAGSWTPSEPSIGDAWPDDNYFTVP